MKTRWMKTLLGATIAPVAIAVLGLAPSDARDRSGGAMSPREVVQHVGDAVVLLDVKKDGLTGQGTGFLVGPDGLLVTSLHVLDGATRLSVVFRDGTRSSDITVRAFDVECDLVAVNVEATGRSLLTIGSTSGLSPGTKILVIGNPLGLEQTVTEGIVSAWREPSDEPADDDSPGSFALELPPCRMIQISADIAAGSSGGPVLGENGEVIGVATSGVHGASGLNFAVPIDDVPDLLANDDAMDLETFGECVDDARLEMARPVYEQASDAHERSELDLARLLVERAIRWYPRYEEALLLSGRIEIARGRADRAEKRIDDAIRVAPDNPDGWYLRGRLHYLLGLSKQDPALITEAEKSYRKALALDPRHGESAFDLGVILAGRGMRDEAETLILVAIASRTRHPDAHYALGEIYLADDRVEEATAEFEQALWDDKDHILAYFGLAKIYTRADSITFGTVAQGGDAEDHWREFLRRSEGVPEVAAQRDAAIRLVREILPHILE